MSQTELRCFINKQWTMLQQAHRDKRDNIVSQQKRITLSEYARQKQEKESENKSVQ